MITECDGGKYGRGCSLTCGACINNTPCHHINGSCLQGCGPGFKGQKCDEECDGNKYGPECSLTCGACINNTQCHHINGSCLHGCDPGYKGRTCDKECSPGTYGINCREACSTNCNTPQSCNRTTGECIGGCQPGWKGLHCDQNCQPGKFGQNCKYTCSVNCKDYNSCDKTSGDCVGGCLHGWQGKHCNRGPKQNSANDFWGMVKCAKYWPDSGVEKECGNLRIKLEKENQFAFYVVRSFKVFHKKANTSRTLTQYHYTSWPDHGTPEPLFLVIFHHHVIASRSPKDTSPTIVHCSAGIGRTGTYIALDALSKAGKMTGKINVTEYVKSMRTDRMNMVQTHEQYKTIFQALHDVFRAPIQSLNISDFVKKVENMSKEEPANWTVIRKEFQQLLAILPVYQQEDYKLAKQNKPPTCSDKILPLDKFNLNLTPLPDHRSCFINAIYVSSYTKEHVFIVTQYPENAVDFLRLLNDHESNYVILLDPSDEIEKQDTKTIVVVEPNKSLKLESGKQDTSSVRALVNYTLGVSPENTITIVSKDGAELCGMFCAIHNCMQQLHMDGNIDVFSTVRQLQICRPEFCSSQAEVDCLTQIRRTLEAEGRLQIESLFRSRS
uniref:Receptor-type tyrosine-protein phosphatase zeta n=1 Tax=Magallana gigas TaxID=29159 RepID=K1QM59_MAGGI